MMKPEAVELFKSEVELMFDLGEHPNIGHAIEVFQDPCSFLLVQPYYRGGNLLGLKSRAVGAGVVPTAAWWSSIFSQSLTGLAHMHSREVMHCDIKEPNIMLRTEDLSKPEVVIIDLGVAQCAATQRKVIYGTPGYIPPEVWEGKNWHPESDMFSFGVVVMQMLIGKMGIFVEKTRTYKEVQEATKQRPPPFELMPIEFPGFRSLAQKLLEKDFQARPTAASLLRENWEHWDADRPAETSGSKSCGHLGAARVESIVTAENCVAPEPQTPLRILKAHHGIPTLLHRKGSPAELAARVICRPADPIARFHAVGMAVQAAARFKSSYVCCG
jgi:serine/threonine protein kinase